MSSTNPSPAGLAGEPAVGTIVLAVAGTLINIVLLKAGAPGYAPLAGQLAIILVGGVPLLMRTLRREEQWYGTGHTGTATVVLAVLLTAAGFCAADLVSTWTGSGSLGYLSKEIPAELSELNRATALRAAPFVAGAAFLIAVAIGHRLRDRARRVLNAATVLYTVSELIIGQILRRHWHDPVIPEDYYLPFVFGALVWITCRIGLWYSLRTQDRYDALYAARARARNGS